MLTLTGAKPGSQFQDGPAFSAYQSVSQTGIASGSDTKIQFQTEEFDTANAFDSTTNYRFQPTVPGYYQINGSIAWNGAYTNAMARIYKNGALGKDGIQVTAFRSIASALVYLNGSTDYIELYGNQASGGAGSIATGSAFTYFQGFLARAA